MEVPVRPCSSVFFPRGNPQRPSWVTIAAMPESEPREDTLAIVVNGESRQIAPGSTVLELLASLGRHPRTVAVELNGEILPRDQYGARVLQGDDRLEVVHFVQGGRD